MIDGKVSIGNGMTANKSAARWMTIRDLCKEIGVSRSTAYKWAARGPASGKFPEFRRLPNGGIRIRRDWFEQWIEGLGPDG